MHNVNLFSDPFSYLTPIKQYVIHFSPKNILYIIFVNYILFYDSTYTQAYFPGLFMNGYGD